MLDRAQPVFELGSFRLDPGQGVLLREGQIVHLTPKALNTLAVLVRQGGRVVDKDVLIQEVWPDTFVEENSLTRNISVLRRTLNWGHERKCRYLNKGETRLSARGCRDAG